MDRIQEIPVGEAGQTLRLEERGLHEPAAAIHGDDLVLQPRPPGYPHLGSKPEQFRTTDLLDAPEVERVTFAQADRVPSSQAHPDPAYQPVGQTAHPPQEVRIWPAGPATEPLDLREEAVGRDGDGELPALDDHALLGGERCRRRSVTRPVRIEPRRIDVVARRPIDRQPQRVRKRQRIEPEPGGRFRVSHDDLGPQSFDEGPGDARRHGRDEVDPVRTQPRCQDGYRDHQPAQAAHPRVRPHHVAVGQDIGAADLDDAGHLGMLERPDQVVEDVGDPDRLAACADPAGRDHHRQPLGQVAKDLERRTARADDHRGPELGDRDTVGGQLGTRFLPACEVVRQLGPVVAQTRRDRRSDPPRRWLPPPRSWRPPADRVRRTHARPRPSSARGSRRPRTPSSAGPSVDGSRRSARTTRASGNRSASDRPSRLVRISSWPSAWRSGTRRLPM